jgi:hypothetical protein
MFGRKKPAADYVCMLYEFSPEECVGIVTRDDVPGYKTTLLRRAGEVWQSVESGSLNGDEIEAAWQQAVANAKRSAEQAEIAVYGDSGIAVLSASEKDAVPGLLLHLEEHDELLGSVGTVLTIYDKFTVIIVRVDDRSDIKDAFKSTMLAFGSLAKHDGADPASLPEAGLWHDSLGFERWSVTPDEKVRPGQRLKALMKAQA